jgi:anti-sigma B factor antagonist
MTVAESLTLNVRRVNSSTSVIDLQGDVTGASENELMNAYNQASSDGARTIALNFEGLEYMNSGGIGLLVTLLVRATRQRQSILAFGLTEHYRHIFELTRLDDAISIHDNEDDAMKAAGAA